MSSTLTIAAFLLSFGPLTAPMATEPALTTLAHLRNTSRPLLVFSPRPSDPQVAGQMAALVDHSKELTDRDVVVIGLPSDAFPQKTSLPSAIFVHLEEQEARRRFHVDPARFTVLLLGKDGGEKLRANSPVSWEALRSTIDAMPMRQEEMRRPRS